MYRQFFKRTIDIIFSIIIICLLLPFIIFIYLLLKFTYKKSFYLHERVGINGKIFNCIKFKTMHEGADELLKTLIINDKNIKEEWNKTYKISKDPRVTKIGKILRKYKLDEIPQFINIIKGEMSIVGPRPLTEDEFSKFFTKNEKIKYLSINPGLTGEWQVNSKKISNYKMRIECELGYVESYNFFKDIKLMIFTLFAIFQ